MYISMIVKHVFEDDLVVVDNFKRATDRLEVLKLLLKPKVLYLFCCFPLLEVDLAVVRLSHYIKYIKISQEI